MPREAYSDRRRYDDSGVDGRPSRDRDGYARNERHSSSSRRDYRETSGREDSHPKDTKRSVREGEATSSSSLQVGRSRRRSSRSPDFEKYRAREREAYDRRRGSRSRDREDGEEEQKKPEEAVFEASGLLAKESNNKNGVALKYAEPPEARTSKMKWRLYVFKDGKEIDVMHISRQSCYLLGRDRAVADIPIDHPSISKQHAVIQFRNIRERNEYGDEKQSVEPFLIDLDSANGCTINDAEVPPSRYYEMRNGDTLKLGGSQREYVLLAEV